VTLQGEIREAQALLRAKLEERKKLEAEIALLEAELEGAALLLANTPSLRRRGRRGRRLRVLAPFREGSAVGLAVAILRDAREPLRIVDIIERLRDAGHSVTKATLAANISRALKQHRIFEQVGKGTFGLKEWGVDTATLG